MDFMNYFQINTEYIMLSNFVYYFLITLIITTINTVFFVKAYRNLKRNLPSLDPVKDFLYAMLGFIIWDLGAILEGITKFITNNQYVIFSSIENMPLSAGMTISIVFFNRYLFSYILVNKRNSKEIKPVKRILTFFSILCAISFIFSLIRFILLGFMSVDFRIQTADFMVVYYGIIAFSGAITMAIALQQLNSERKSVASKLNRSRMTIYMIFAISFFLIIGDVALYMISTELLPKTEFGQTLRLWIGLPIDSFHVFAMLSLYYGMFMPNWLQKKMGILPNFDKSIK